MSTTLGTSGALYEWGSFDDTETWRPLAEDVVATSGLFGLVESGPILFTIHAGSGRTVVPSARFGTETVYAVIRGSAVIDGRRYEAGDLRIQNTGAALGEVVSGPDGLDMVFVVADRREQPELISDHEDARAWKDAYDAMYSELSAA